jgi:quinol monooxygenase YgiN
MSDNMPDEYAGEGVSLPPNPNPKPDWSQDDPAHPGFVVHGLDDTPGPKAYYIHLEAKPGKEELLQGFLQDINAGVDKEPDTGPWFALRYSKTTFCIFEAFPDAQARHTHDNGPGGQNFLRSELLHDMLAYPAQLYRLDVLHGKFGVMLGKPVKPA